MPQGAHFDVGPEQVAELLEESMRIRAGTGLAPRLRLRTIRYSIES